MKKKIIIIFSIMMMLLVMVACSSSSKEVSYGDSDKSIYCNIADEHVELKNVTFYNSYDGQVITVSKGGDVASKSFNSKALTFTDGKVKNYCV